MDTPPTPPANADTARSRGGHAAKKPDPPALDWDNLIARLRDLLDNNENRGRP